MVDFSRACFLVWCVIHTFMVPLQALLWHTDLSFLTSRGGGPCSHCFVTEKENAGQCSLTSVPSFSLSLSLALTHPSSLSTHALIADGISVLVLWLNEKACVEGQWVGWWSCVQPLYYQIFPTEGPVSLSLQPLLHPAQLASPTQTVGLNDAVDFCFF